MIQQAGFKFLPHTAWNSWNVTLLLKIQLSFVFNKSHVSFHLTKAVTKV